MRTQRTGWRHFLLGKRAYGINPPVQCTRWFMHRNAPAKCTLARCSSGRRPRNTLVPHVRGWIPHHLVSVALCASKVHTGAARVGGGLATHWYPTCAVGSHTTWSVWLSAPAKCTLALLEWEAASQHTGTPRARLDPTPPGQCGSLRHLCRLTCITSCSSARRYAASSSTTSCCPPQPAASASAVGRVRLVPTRRFSGLFALPAGSVRSEPLGPR
jgi:hypothetical protein